MRALLPQLWDDKSVHNLLVQDGGGSQVQLNHWATKDGPVDTTVDQSNNNNDASNVETCSKQWFASKGDKEGGDRTSKLCRVHLGVRGGPAWLCHSSWSDCLTLTPHIICICSPGESPKEETIWLFVASSAFLWFSWCLLFSLPKTYLNLIETQTAF